MASTAAGNCPILAAYASTPIVAPLHSCAMMPLAMVAKVTAVVGNGAAPVEVGVDVGVGVGIMVGDGVEPPVTVIGGSRSAASVSLFKRSHARRSIGL